MKKFFLLLLLCSVLWGEKIVVGKFERVSFEEFGLKDIKAKIDTGAKTSSLHCSFIQETAGGYVSFILLDKDHKKFSPFSHKVKISRTAFVKSSNGRKQKRYFIKTAVSLLGKEYFTEFSLTDRGSMKFPVLIGRSLLKEGFLVDVTQSYTSQK